MPPVPLTMAGRAGIEPAAPKSGCVSFHAATGPSRCPRAACLSSCLRLRINGGHPVDPPRPRISQGLRVALSFLSLVLKSDRTSTKPANGRPGGARTRMRPATSGSTVVPTYPDSHGAERYISAASFARSNPRVRRGKPRAPAYLSRPGTRLPPFGDPDLLRTALSLRRTPGPSPFEGRASLPSSSTGRFRRPPPCIPQGDADKREKDKGAERKGGKALPKPCAQSEAVSDYPDPCGRRGSGVFADTLHLEGTAKGTRVSVPWKRNPCTPSGHARAPFRVLSGTRRTCGPSSSA